MPNWIGDFVMATPVLEDLRRLYPLAKIVALCSGVLGELLENNPFINEVIPFSRKNRFFPKGLIPRLRKEKYDLGILLTNSFSSAFHFWIGGVKKRIGFYKRSRAFLLSENREYKKDLHLVETYKSLIGTSSDTLPKLFISPSEKKIGKTVFGINPGAAYGSAKCWPPERFQEVIEKLLKQVPNSEVIVFGDKATKEIADLITERFDERVINLAGKTTLKELISEIGRVDAFLTNDSGPMHIANSLQVPLVAVFGSTNPLATGPYKFGKVIYKKVSCSPCYKRVCPIDFRCMRGVEVDEVVQEMKKALITKAVLQKPFKVSWEGAKEPSFTTSDEQHGDRECGVIILAAGMGRRLGFEGAKGLLKVQDKTLYETLLEKAGKRVAIMTSPATYEGTKRFLEEKGFDYVDLFQERSLPRLSDVYEESPEGNGALFSTFYGSPIWEKWSDVDEIRVIPIDNPLAEPLFLGDSELAVMAIEKREGEQNLGSLVDKEGHLFVLEYFEMPDEEKESWKLGYSGIFSCTKDFFEKAAKLEMPWHTVTRNGIKHFEKFVFDAFFLAKTYKIILKKREYAFHPIKTKQDLVYFTREVMK